MLAAFAIAYLSIGIVFSIRGAIKNAPRYVKTDERMPDPDHPGQEMMILRPVPATTLTHLLNGLLWLPGFVALTYLVATKRIKRL